MQHLESKHFELHCFVGLAQVVDLIEALELKEVDQWLVHLVYVQ